MAHSAPPPAAHRPFERAIGVAALVLGILLIVVTVMALHHPKGRQAQTAAVVPTSSSPASTVPPKTKTPNTTAPKTTSPASRTPVVTPTPTSTSPSTSPAGSAKLPLVVLNNTSDTSASTAAARFAAGGWSVTSTSTFSGDILSTAAYYDPDTAGAEAAAEALQRQFPAIQRVKEKFDGLPAGPIVIVLTSDYS